MPQGSAKIRTFGRKEEHRKLAKVVRESASSQVSDTTNEKGWLTEAQRDFYLSPVAKGTFDRKKEHRKLAKVVEELASPQVSDTTSEKGRLTEVQRDLYLSPVDEEKSDWLSDWLTKLNIPLIEASLLESLEYQGVPLDKISVQVLDLSPGVSKQLKKANIHTIKQLSKCTEGDLLRIDHIGASRVERIKKSLTSFLDRMSGRTKLSVRLEASLLAMLEDERVPLDRISVQVLGLSARGYHALKNANINTIQQLICVESDLLSIPNIGVITRDDIRNKLISYITGSQFKQRGTLPTLNAKGSVSRTQLLNIFAQYPRCFTLEELLIFADSDSDNKSLRDILLADPRFLQLKGTDSSEEYFISKASLFQWFCHLSLRLARAKQARLSKRQVASLMSFLRIDGRWDIPPVEGIRFGKKFGFVSSAWTTNQYVFPLAHILSFMPRRLSKTTIEYVMEGVPLDRDVDLPYEYLAGELVRNGFSKLDKKSCYIIKAREGLLTGTKMTLQEVGDHLAGHITRERVRQIESKLWIRLRHPDYGRAFCAALLYKIMSKQGSLIIPQNSSDTLLISFLAKCAGAPQVEFPHTNIVVLGTTLEDVALPKFTGSFQKRFDVSFIAARLGLKRQLCLIKSDLKILAKSLVQFHRKRLTKRQKAYLALRAIGKPAHCREITEVYNSLFPREPSTEHNLHAVLSHESYGVVWIGIRSTFALKEWGYEHPTISLFDAVTEITEQKYKETGQPVPFTVIVAEMGKRRQIAKLSSLTIAAHCNPSLRRVSKDSFIPRESNKEIQEEIAAEELDRILKEFEKKM